MNENRATKTKTKTTMATATLLAVLLVPGLAAAGSQQQADRTLEADPDIELSIELVVGEIEVVGWDRNEVQITASMGADVEELQVSGDRTRIHIEPDLPNQDRHWGRDHSDVDVDLRVQAPRGARLDIEAVTAPVTVRDIEGRITIESVTGDVDIQGSPEEMEISVVSGSLDARVDEVQRASLEAVSGNIEFEGSVSRSGRLDASTVSGRIDLTLPGDIAADFDVESFSGSIDNAFGQEAKRTSRWVPSQELRFSNNGGGARITLETLSGTIRIRTR